MALIFSPIIADKVQSLEIYTRDFFFKIVFFLNSVLSLTDLTQ